MNLKCLEHPFAVKATLIEVFLGATFRFFLSNDEARWYLPAPEAGSHNMAYLELDPGYHRLKRRNERIS